MKRTPLALAVPAAFLFLTGAAHAHRVNVFAFVDGDHIQVECGFSRSQRVKNGKLVVADLETGDIVVEGVTDEQGVFRFRPPDDFLRTGHGLRILLLAGEGHQDEWRISGEELRALSPPAPRRATSGSAPVQPGLEAARQPPAADRVDAPARQAAPAAFDAGELEAVIGRVLDAKLGPINQALNRRRDDDPDWRDIVGGIGWIAGLLGLATYLRHRRRDRHD